MLQTFRTKVQSRFIAQPDELTCQAACIEMVLKTGSVQGVRDRLLRLGTAGDPYVMGEILRSELGNRYEFDDNASLSQAREHLKDGCFLITHGWFTRSGHVIAIDGVTIDPETLSYRLHALDPWSEFNARQWLYNLGSVGFEGYYSSHLMYAACVAGRSVSDAFSLYRRGELDSARKGMWLHIVKP